MTVRTWVLCLSLGAVAGCESFNGDDNDRDRDRGRVSRDDRYDRDHDRSPSVSSRATSAGVASDATRVESGSGQTMSWKASRDGMVYVYDVDNDRMAYSGRIRSGDQIVVNPDTNRINVGDQRVSNRDLAARSRYEIFFSDSAGSSGGNRPSDRYDRN